MSKTEPAVTERVALDRTDERLATRKLGAAGWFAGSLGKIKDGELGLLPVVVGLLVIGTIFQTLNSFFLSSANLVNLLMQSSAVGVIALGIVCVLLLGEIDLSVGSVSGLSAAIFAVSLMNRNWPTVVAVLLAVAAGALIGLVYSLIFNRFGVPSFVITLAGLLAFLGLQLYVLGPAGTINLPFESQLVWFGQTGFVPAWLSYVLCLVLAGGFFVSRYIQARARKAADLAYRSLTGLLIQTALAAAGLIFVVWYLNKSRGVGWMFVFFLALVLIVNHLLVRTSWGRSVYAVGGNREAARRAGINVTMVYTSVFVLCSSLAAVGGLLAAGRLASAAQSSGAGDVNLNAIAAAVIGGTSLFGGRGTAFAALLGIIVIQSISSGLTLLNLDADVRYMVTGVVLLLAVTIDAASRKTRTTHGRA